MKAKTVNIIKAIIYWLIIAVVTTAYILYLYLDWTTLVNNFSSVVDGIIKSIAILLISSAVIKISTFVVGHMGTHSQRGQTVSKLLVSLLKYAFGIIAIMLVLSNFIADTTSIITGLSMLTLVVGLGAQSLISDIVAGIFIVFEGDYKVGDVVVIDNWRGVVNEIGIRTTKIEDTGGNIQIINNSKISKIINNSTQLSIAVCEVGIAYSESIERVENILKQNLEIIKQHIPAIKEGPYYKGIETLGASAVVIKIIAKCGEDDKFQVQRDLNREIKIIFDNNKVNIPFPQVTVSRLEESVVETNKKDKAKARKFVDEQKKLADGVDQQND